MFNAKMQSNFIDNNTCNFIINSVKDSEAWEKIPNDFWDKRIININTAYNKIGKDFGDLITKISQKTKDFIEKEYSLDKKIEPNVVTICRWFPGMNQPPHADDMTNTDIKGLEGRVFGAIIYLNQDYKGGKTYYPDYNIEINPEVGKIAVHPGDPSHMHGVTTIEGNTRYTIASFWEYKN